MYGHGLITNTTQEPKHKRKWLVYSVYQLHLLPNLRINDIFSVSIKAKFSISGTIFDAAVTSCDSNREFS